MPTFSNIAIYPQFPLSVHKNTVLDSIIYIILYKGTVRVYYHDYIL